jgi:hypothetical protein
MESAHPSSTSCPADFHSSASSAYPFHLTRYSSSEVVLLVRTSTRHSTSHHLFAHVRGVCEEWRRPAEGDGWDKGEGCGEWVGEGELSTRERLGVSWKVRGRALPAGGAAAAAVSGATTLSAALRAGVRFRLSRRCSGAKRARERDCREVAVTVALLRPERPVRGGFTHESVSGAGSVFEGSARACVHPSCRRGSATRAPPTAPAVVFSVCGWKTARKKLQLHGASTS